MTWLVPNILTGLRLVAVPALVALVLADDAAGGPLRWWALVVFLGASATDVLDGYLARRWRVVSTLGKIADPIADKVLVLAALAALSVVDGVAWWPAIVLAVREVAVTIGRLAVLDRQVIAAGSGGKAKTATQTAAITFFLIPAGGAVLDTIAWWLLVAAVAIAIVSGWRYLAAIVSVARRPRASADAS